MTFKEFSLLFLGLMNARMYFNVGADVAQVWYEGLRDLPDVGIEQAVRHYTLSADPWVNLGMVREYAKGNTPERPMLPERTPLTQAQREFNKAKFIELREELNKVG